ncbi:MAG: DegT/DnrJ/EryC1/StrS family aminotransferase [Pirellulaceae bacterium]
MIERQSNQDETARLAIQGGPAAVTAPIPGWPPPWPEVEQSVRAALTDGSWGQYHGRPVSEFVDAFASYVGVPHVWPCASGTVAVELALRGCGVQPGDEVILAGYDFPGNFRAIEALGARPVLVDVRAGGYVIDATAVAAAVNKRTRAVVVSHLHGQLADVRSICDAVDVAQVAVVEDACQVPGAVVDGRPAGTSGHAGTFSFGGSKLLTAGRGGAVVTGDESIMQRMRIAAERGNDAWPLSALQAAALQPQLATLDDDNRRRLAAATRLRDALRDSSLFTPVLDDWNAASLPAFYKFALQVSDQHSRQHVIDALNAEGVPADSGFRGFMRRSLRRCTASGPLDNSTRAAERTILLHHPLLLGDQALLDQVIAALHKVEACLDC